MPTGAKNKLVVPHLVRSCNQSGQVVISPTAERDVIQQVAPPNVRWYNQLRDYSCDCVIHDHQRQSTGGAARHSWWCGHYNPAES